MAKEWILNMATNRWGLNKKDSGGPVSLWIRECDPKKTKEWEDFYYKKLAEMLIEKKIDLTPREYIQDLGRRLYTKITEVIQAEIEEVTEDDCLRYIYDLVINRTFDGYQTEIKTIYGQLQQILKTHDKFEQDRGGKVFIVFSIKEDDKKVIHNPEVIGEIKKEFERLGIK